MVVTNVGGQENRSTLGIVGGDVTDGTGKTLDGMPRGLDVALGRISQVKVIVRHVDFAWLVAVAGGCVLWTRIETVRWVYKR
jgi:hypothetical protein